MKICPLFGMVRFTSEHKDCHFVDAKCAEAYLQNWFIAYCHTLQVSVKWRLSPITLSLPYP